jgi:hypothetical protein
MKLKVAVIATVYFPRSHADVIVSRWLEPLATDARYGWSAARSEIASMYIEQMPKGDPAVSARRADGFDPLVDMSRAVSARYGVPLFDSVRDALTLGGDKLAVDAVLLIGEHGNYEYNRFGQKMYPRRELFDSIVSVLREQGRAIPVFCDKHLSWDADSARHMVQTAQKLDIPLLAGSSLPFCGFVDGRELPPADEIEEVVSIFSAGAEVYGFHSLEWVQSVIEGRAGGESGVRSICAYSGPGVWDALERGELSAALLGAALAQCRSTASGDARDNCCSSTEDDGLMCPISPVAFCLERNDGLRDTHVMLHGHTSAFAMAVRCKGTGAVVAACSALSGYEAEEFCPHFAVLNRVVEEFFVTRQLPIPRSAFY